MNERKSLVVVRPRRRHLRPEERAQVLALWTRGRWSAEEVARQAGVSRSSLQRWKRTLGAPVLVTPGNAPLVEVPAPTGGLGVAEVLTREGLVRLSGTAAPAWAAQLVRELNRC